MPRSKASKPKPRRTTARPRKAADERMISVLGTLLEPSPWGRISASDVTPEVAVRVSSIFAVCRFIGQGLGVMPIQIGRTLPNGRKERFSPPCAYTLRSRPNGWQSRFDFMTLQAYWTALHGNGFARILPGIRPWMPEDSPMRNGGFCAQLIPMHPSRVRVEQLADYSMRYAFFDSSGKWIPLRQEEVLHWRWMSENGIWGMAPSEICATSISLARQLDIAATSFWKNGARPDFLIQTAEKISDPAIAELREQFRLMYSGHNRGSPGVVSNKVSLVPMQSNTMEQSQYLELRSAILPDVCRHWGVPSTLLGDAKMARYSNVEQEHLSAQVWCLLPWQHRMEGPLDMALQPVYGENVYCKLDSRGLLRGDNASRAALYQSLFNMAALRPNELRDLEDFELLDDPAADQTYMQLGFSTLANAAAAGKPQASHDATADATPVDSSTLDAAPPQDQQPDASVEPPQTENVP